MGLFLSGSRVRGVDRASSLVVIALVCRGYVLPGNLGYYWIMVNSYDSGSG